MGLGLIDQPDWLASAREASPDLGFMGRLLAPCSLPRTNPSDQAQLLRHNEPFSLVLGAGALTRGLPCGNLPRLLLAWVCTAAVRTQQRELVLGQILSDFMGRLGIFSTSGYGRQRLRDQMKRLFACSISLIYRGDDKAVRTRSLIDDHATFRWDYKQPAASVLFSSEITLGYVVSGRH